MPFTLSTVSEDLAWLVDHSEYWTPSAAAEAPTPITAAVHAANINKCLSTRTYTARASCWGSHTSVVALFFARAVCDDTQTVSVSLYNKTPGASTPAEGHHQNSGEQASVRQELCSQHHMCRPRSEVWVTHWEGQPVVQCRATSPCPVAPVSRTTPPTDRSTSFLCSEHRKRRTERNLDFQHWASTGVYRCSCSSLCQ